MRKRTAFGERRQRKGLRIILRGRGKTGGGQLEVFLVLKTTG